MNKRGNFGLINPLSIHITSNQSPGGLDWPSAYRIYFITSYFLFPVNHWSPRHHILMIIKWTISLLETHWDDRICGYSYQIAGIVWFQLWWQPEDEQKQRNRNPFEELLSIPSHYPNISGRLWLLIECEQFPTFIIPSTKYVGKERMTVSSTLV